MVVIIDIPYAVDIGAITSQPIRNRAFNQGLDKGTLKSGGGRRWNFSPPVLWNNILIRLHKICIIGSTFTTHYSDIIKVGTYIDSIVGTIWFFFVRARATFLLRLNSVRDKAYIILIWLKVVYNFLYYCISSPFLFFSFRSLFINNPII